MAAQGEVIPDPIAVEIVSVDPRDLRLLEKNARFMKADVFQRLVANVKRDGVLTSLPFCVAEDEGLRVLSGNHRVLAAIAAGLPSIDVLISQTELSVARQRAIQLSHNAIVGEDDPLTLRAIFTEIGDEAWKAYSGLDDAALALLVKAAEPGLGATGMEMTTLTLAFLPGEVEGMREALGAALAGKPDEVWLAPFALYDRTVDMLDTVSLACQVRSMAVAFAHLLDVFGRHLGELRPELEKGNGDFPLAVLFERSEVPRESARRVQRALAKVAEDPWEALETLAVGVAPAKERRERVVRPGPRTPPAGS